MRIQLWTFKLQSHVAILVRELGPCMPRRPQLLLTLQMVRLRTKISVSMCIIRVYIVMVNIIILAYLIQLLPRLLLLRVELRQLSTGCYCHHRLQGRVSSLLVDLPLYRTQQSIWLLLGRVLTL